MKLQKQYHGTLDLWEMLELLLAQEQFYLELPSDFDGKQAQNLRLVYLMNDAVESFLIFQNAILTGNYEQEYEGNYDFTLGMDEKAVQRKYHLIVRQQEVFTIFFDDLDLEIHLYSYANIGHFWVKGYEYLRQIEYKTAILKDKWDYIGEDACNATEQELAALADFPPLNYISYPSVPKQYLVPRPNAHIPTKQAIQVMTSYALQAGDTALVKWVQRYEKHHGVCMTKWFSMQFRKKKHQKFLTLLEQKFLKACMGYSQRDFGEKENTYYKELLQQAENQKNQYEKQGIRTMIFSELPFVQGKDSIQFHVYLMIWEKTFFGQKIKVQEIDKK